MRWNNVWKFKTARFSISLDWEWEESPDLSWDDTGEVRAKLNNGEWGNYTFRVQILLDGREVASDYLGNSIYADPREFYTEHLGVRARSRVSGQNFGCYFTDMVDRAIDEARKLLANAPRLRKGRE